MTKKIALENLRKSWRKKEIFKIAQNWPFLAFFKFQTQIFLSFLVFFTQFLFFWTTKLLLFSQKIFDTCAMNISKIMDILGGRVKFHMKFDSPQNGKNRFRRHCRKTLSTLYKNRRTTNFQPQPQDAMIKLMNLQRLLNKGKNVTKDQVSILLYFFFLRTWWSFERST